MDEFIDLAEFEANDRYSFVERINSGSYGEVWIAHDQVLNQKVAIKKIHLWNRDRPEVEKLLRTEARAGRQIGSPHVLKVYDLIKINRQDCLVMEYVAGWTLYELIRSGQYSSILLRQNVRHLCLGLSAIHDSGFAHRDLRPDNIIVDYQGRLVIIDLGLADIVEQGQARNQHPYLAPELGKDPSYILSDIYSLGGLLAFLAGAEQQKTLRPSEVWLAPIISKCQATNPEDRYPSARAVLHDIEQAQLQFAKTNRFSFLGTKKKLIIAGLALAGALSLFAFRPPKQNSQVDTTIPVVVMPESDDKQSQLFADLIASYLETQHMLVSRPVRWIDLKKSSMGTTLYAHSSVIHISSKGSQGIPSIRLRLMGANNTFLKEATFSHPNVSPMEVLSGVAAVLHLKTPDTRFDFALDGYTTERFAATWQQAWAGDIDNQDQHLCRAGQSFPALLLNARASIQLFSTTKSDFAHQCAMTNVTRLKSSGLATSQALLLSASLFQSENSTAEGVKMLQSAVETQSAPSAIYRTLSENALQGGFVSEALNFATQSIKTDPFAIQNYITAARAYISQGLDEKAIQLLQAALSLDPSSNTVCTNLGAVYIRAGKFEEAKAVLERAVEIKPTPETSLVLGLANLLCGHSRQGLLILSGAASAHPTLHSLATLGAAYRWVGESENAYAALRNALKLGHESSTNAVELGYLAMVYAQLNQITRADEVLSRASKHRSSLDTELLYDSLIVDAFAGRRDNCIRKLRILKEHHFPIAFLMKDPQVFKILQGSS